MADLKNKTRPTPLVCSVGPARELLFSATSMSRPQRLSTISYVGPARYFLTFCTRERLEAFRDADVVALTLDQFRRTAEDEKFAILAYCLMPDHAHLLVDAVDQDSDFKRFAKMAKQRSGGVYRKRRGSRLWQEGYYERVLRDEDDVLQIARYILNNPVRAGLGESPADYPHLGSDRWSLEELLESVAFQPLGA
jgi:putative transposase